MELEIKDVKDIAKLEGWTIKSAAFQLAAGVDPVIQFELTHLAAEHPVLLALTSSVNFGRSGNIMLVNASLTLHTEDIKE